VHLGSHDKTTKKREGPDEGQIKERAEEGLHQFGVGGSEHRELSEKLKDPEEG